MNTRILHSLVVRSPIHTPLVLLIDTTHRRASTSLPSGINTHHMGKSDKQQTKKRARKTTCESKHKKQQSFDAMTFEPTDDEGTRHSQWCDQFRQLCEYKVQYGHCRVPVRYSTNPKLGNWVSTQRTTHRLNQEGNPSCMTEERIRALNGIGFDWGTSQTDYASVWNVRFQQLCEFKAQFGHCLVLQQYAANPTLGKWVNTQRRC
jgi:hypothetical protein